MNKWIQNYKTARENQLSNVERRHQTFCKKRKRIENPKSDSENIHFGYKDGIYQSKMHYANNEGR